MDILNQRLPKDLVNIIEEYAKDRTNYAKMMIELKNTFFMAIFDSYKNVTVRRIILEDYNIYISLRNKVLCSRIRFHGL